MLMPDLIDFMERATQGPILTENDFNLKVLIPTIRKTVREFDLQYKPQDPVPGDDTFADRLYAAAIELLVRTGIYCDGTNRLIRFERQEILEALANLPEGAWFGEGHDRRLFRPRRPGDPRPPWCHVGTGIVASSDDLAISVVEGYGAIPQASSISIPAFNRVRGMPVIGGSPLEIYAASSAVQVARKALGRTGRPGLPILNLISSATTSMGTLAASHPVFGLRPSDGWLIDFLAEMKVNFETLNRLAFAQMIGGNIGSTALPILGGYAGGPEGTALVMTAYFLAGILMMRGDYHLTGPIHFRYGCSTTRDALWIFSVVGRAASRNIPYPAIALGYAAAGAATRMYFYEAAAVILSSTVSGYAGVQTVHPGKAIIEDGVTPLEASFCARLAHAVTGMSAEQASAVVDRLLRSYESQVESAPRGSRYPECYDVQNARPSPEYQRLYADVLDELAGLGVPVR
jgi:methylamine--corrinoid protein Co-methyltransferase